MDYITPKKTSQKSAITERPVEKVVSYPLPDFLSDKIVFGGERIENIACGR